MALNFNQYAKDGNAFIKDYAREMEIDDLEKAGRILSSIFFALREVISIEESLQFIAQLPMFIKAAYVNRWSSKKRKSRIKHMDEFIELVRKFDEPSTVNDFGYDNDIVENYISSTFTFLQKYISAGELNDIKSELPKELKKLIFNRLMF